MQLSSDTSRKTYYPPKLNRLTAEQAKLILLGHASIGHRGATAVLSFLYQAPQAVKQQELFSSPPRATSSGSPTRDTSRISLSVLRSLIRSVLRSREFVRESFWRAIRG